MNHLNQILVFLQKIFLKLATILLQKVPSHAIFYSFEKKATGFNSLDFYNETVLDFTNVTFNLPTHTHILNSKVPEMLGIFKTILEIPLYPQLELKP